MVFHSLFGWSRSVHLKSGNFLSHSFKKVSQRSIKSSKRKLPAFKSRIFLEGSGTIPPTLHSCYNQNPPTIRVKKFLLYVLCFQNVTDIIDDVDKLFKELIVRKPLGVILDNAMEQHLRRNSSINFTLPMVNIDYIKYKCTK